MTPACADLRAQLATATARVAALEGALAEAEARCQWLANLAPLFIALNRWIKVRKGLTAAGQAPTPSEMDVWDAYADVAFRLLQPEAPRAPGGA